MCIYIYIYMCVYVYIYAYIQSRTHIKTLTRVPSGFCRNMSVPAYI